MAKKYKEIWKHQEVSDNCRTKYPLLMVHGVFFRDWENFNYWGRIPSLLIQNGATIFYGNQQSADTIEQSAKDISLRIKEILAETGAEKVNIIAHSKGGLDSRYAISVLGMAPYVASLTTINTPHQGCKYAEYFLNKFSKRKQKFVAYFYNRAFKKHGDPNPDFIGGVSALSYEKCQELNKIMLDMPGIFYQSVGSKINRAIGGQFPLFLTYNIVKHFDGENDGLVGRHSYKWGERSQFLETKHWRGISHGDMIDLNRKDLKSFDVRGFYLKLVSELKEKGL